ncbi:MAG: hypothetical protein JNJ75_13060 [Cyclobacteriaceae bacterium]|nr:hypothetical protein [Cyclobacteriaceae bacterium]
MKYWYFSALLLLFYSCNQKHDDGAVAMSVKKRDSLIIQYIADQFNMHSPYYKYDLKKQLEWLRKSTDNERTLEASFKNYHLKSFLFDALSRPPFVVEITNDKNEFVDLFSFTDEDYYSGNSINRNTPRGKPTKADSIHKQKINLETNLNNLSRKLGLTKRNEMLELTSAICYVLSMKPISPDSIQQEIKSYCAHRGSLADDTIFRLIEQEQYKFFRKGDGDVITVRTQSVFGLGYWRLWVDESDEPIIKAVFFSDILFQPMYM